MTDIDRVGRIGKIFKDILGLNVWCNEYSHTAWFPPRDCPIRLSCPWQPTRKKEPGCLTETMGTVLASQRFLLSWFANLQCHICLFAVNNLFHLNIFLRSKLAYNVPALVLEPATTYYWRVRQTAGSGKQSEPRGTAIMPRRAGIYMKEPYSAGDANRSPWISRMAVWEIRTAWWTASLSIRNAYWNIITVQWGEFCKNMCWMQFLK
jgi:hypothetical protein